MLKRRRGSGRGERGVEGRKEKRVEVHVICITQQIPVADPEGVLWVPWVPWNPSFEGLLLKILCANVLCTLYAHTGATHFSFTVAITHVC